MATARLLGVHETSTVGTLAPAPAALLAAGYAHTAEILPRGLMRTLTARATIAR